MKVIKTPENTVYLTFVMLTSSEQNVCRRENSRSHFAEEDRDGPRNAGLLAIRTPDAATSPRKFYRI